MLAIMPVLGLGADDPKPSPAPQSQETPPPKTAPDSTAGRQVAPAAPGPAQVAAPFGAADPAKPAEPKPPADAKVPGAVPVDEKTFVIGAEDQLIISVYQNAAVGCQICLVRPDGRISLPFVGDIVAAGRTPEQLGKDIAARLDEFIKEPVVTVSLAGVHSKKYYLQGQVKQPGRHDLIMPTTVMEALVGAGGFLDFADTKHIVIARGDKRLTFNYNDVVKGKNLKQNILLEDGDMILVK